MDVIRIEVELLNAEGVWQVVPRIELAMLEHDFVSAVVDHIAILVDQVPEAVDSVSISIVELITVLFFKKDVAPVISIKSTNNVHLIKVATGSIRLESKVSGTVKAIMISRVLGHIISIGRRVINQSLLFKFNPEQMGCLLLDSLQLKFLALFFGESRSPIFLFCLLGVLFSLRSEVGF